jgi:hypothetical protein
MDRSATALKDDKPGSQPQAAAAAAPAATSVSPAPNAPPPSNQGPPLSDFIFRSPGVFDANFDLGSAPGYQPTAAEQAYLDRLSASIAGFRLIHIPEPLKDDADLVQQKEHVRDRAVKELRQRAEEFAALPRGGGRDRKAATELNETYRIEGRYKEWNLRVETIPFTIVPLPCRGKTDVYNDLRINTKDVKIPEEKARLKVELDGALTVVKVVFGEREKSIGWRAWIIGRYAARIEAVQARLHEYITELAGIARVGLTNMDPTQAAFARADLARFKEEFRAREGGTVKNRYLRRLGGYCLLATLLMALGYGAAGEADPGTVWHDFRNFFLLAMGTAIGTWLSFSLRRVTLTFDDLAVLEEDRLDPSLRVLFMVGLTTVVGLLFWTHAVSVGIGDLESSSAIQQHGAGALLVGLLAGIAERALGTAVSRRATDFAAAIGSSAAPATGGRAAAPQG